MIAYLLKSFNIRLQPEAIAAKQEVIKPSANATVKLQESLKL